MTHAAKRFPHVVATGMIVVLVCGLYVPFLGNPLIFDDKGFFSGQAFAYYATHPFGLALRVPSYFSIAIVHVLWGQIVEHRVLSLVLHVACSLALYKLIYGLLRAAQHSGPSDTIPVTQQNAVTWAFIGAALFAIHPMAVYGAAYLVQRAIILATLFSLLSVVLFVRGLTRASHADAISAALLYSVAVLCKEHSVLLPAVAVLAVPLVKSEYRFAIRHSAIYWAACAPAAIFVTLLSKGLIGSAYEPDFGVVATQIEAVFGHNIADFPWSLSAVTQAGLFFKYLTLWLWPDTRAMSIDMHPDYLATWSMGWMLFKVSAFAAFGALGIMLLRRRGRAGVVGFGLLYTWILFLVEFSAVRFQEPFVLYRSYLWAPGILIALAALLSSFPRRAALAIFVFACPVLLYQAHDRLVTFSSPLLLWEDAVAALPAQPVPWGSRALYNLGREYLYSGQPDKAIGITEKCMTRYPNTFHCYFARGSIYLQLAKYEQALPYLAQALELEPKNEAAYRNLGLALEKLGRLEEAKALYRRASENGLKGADNEIRRLESPDGGRLSRKNQTTPTH